MLLNNLYLNLDDSFWEYIMIHFFNYSFFSVILGLAFLASVFTDDKGRGRATGRAFGGVSIGIICKQSSFFNTLQKTCFDNNVIM